jgi:FemAB-related protein (PEP-CTERM system-associated)
VDDAAPRDAIARYVSDHLEATAYHRPEWLELIERAFGQRTMYLAALTADRIAGVLPLVFFDSRLFGRFVVSIPFVNYGGLLADSPEVERALLARAVEETQRAGGAHLELRHTRQCFSELAAKRHKVAMLLTLERDHDAQWAAIDRKVRNQIRKAEKSDLHTTVGGEELLPSFYQVFARNMRDLGTPVYARKFFHAVLRTFPEHSRVVVVTHRGQPVAASIVHWHRDVIQVPWASALREFNPLCVNVLLYWQMIRFAIERGFRAFDFGRSTPGEGTFQFKKQWGAQPLELVWEYWTADGVAVPELNPKNPKFDIAIRAWQRLPVTVANAIGPHIVRNIP